MLPKHTAHTLEQLGSSKRILWLYCAVSCFPNCSGRLDRFNGGRPNLNLRDYDGYPIHIINLWPVYFNQLRYTVNSVKSSRPLFTPHLQDTWRSILRQPSTPASLLECPPNACSGQQNMSVWRLRYVGVHALLSVCVCVGGGVYTFDFTNWKRVTIVLPHCNQLINSC